MFIDGEGLVKKITLICGRYPFYIFCSVSADGTLLCRNQTLFRTMKSLRYLGPLDTTIPSISIYSGTDSDLAGGIERTFTGLAANDFGFLPAWMLLTGRSSWTGFSSPDFSGNSTCFSTSELMGGAQVDGNPMRSLIKGCNSKYRSDYWNVDKLT